MFPVLRRFRQVRYCGLYRATGMNATDPLQSHRVQVRIPSVTGSPSMWAPTVRDVGGRPQVGDEVLVKAACIQFSSEAGSVDSGQCTYSGVVKSQTLIADKVVATQYTPGIGNMM